MMKCSSVSCPLRFALYSRPIRDPLASVSLDSGSACPAQRGLPSPRHGDPRERYSDQIDWTDRRTRWRRLAASAGTADRRMSVRCALSGDSRAADVPGVRHHEAGAKSTFGREYPSTGGGSCVSRRLRRLRLGARRSQAQWLAWPGRRAAAPPDGAFSVLGLDRVPVCYTRKPSDKVRWGEPPERPRLENRESTTGQVDRDRVVVLAAPPADWRWLRPPSNREPTPRSARLAIRAQSGRSWCRFSIGRDRRS